MLSLISKLGNAKENVIEIVFPTCSIDELNVY